MVLSLPTILVKKADGTSVRMTMDEFKKYKENLSTSTPEQLNAKAPIEALPMETQSQALATSTPVTDIFIDEAAAMAVAKDRKIERSKDQILPNIKQWTEGDQVSPLEEKVEETDFDLESLPSNKEDEFSGIMKKIKFPVTDKQLSRLRPLVVSRLKDVRTDDQVIEYCLKLENSGGLGWSQDQAKQLLEAIKNLNTQSLNHSSTLPPYHPTTKPLDHLVNESLQSQEIPPNQTVLINSQAARPIIHDVIAPVVEKRSVGPIEELKMFSLTDFRRLSNKPSQAGKILADKFAVFKKESYLLFFEALNAWQVSPLYKQYQGVIREALEKKTKIASLLDANNGQGSQMKTTEFTALVEVNSQLNN